MPSKNDIIHEMDEMDETEIELLKAKSGDLYYVGDVLANSVLEKAFSSYDRKSGMVTFQDGTEAYQSNVNKDFDTVRETVDSLVNFNKKNMAKAAAFQRKREAHLQATVPDACQEIVATVTEHDGVYDAPAKIAKLLELFDIDGDDFDSQFVGWVLEAYGARKMKQNIPGMRYLYMLAKDNNFTKRNEFRYNDDDYGLYFIPHETKKIFVLKSQEDAFIFIGENDFNTVHIRHLNDQNQWRKITLKDLAAVDYKPTYGDGRDKGYVASYSAWASENSENDKVESWHYSWVYAHMAFFLVRATQSALNREGKFYLKGSEYNP